MEARDVLRLHLHRARNALGAALGRAVSERDRMIAVLSDNHLPAATVAHAAQALADACSALAAAEKNVYDATQLVELAELEV